MKLTDRIKRYKYILQTLFQIAAFKIKVFFYKLKNK